MTPFLSELYAHLHLEQAGELFAAELWEQLDATEASRRNGHLSESAMKPAEIRRLTFSALLASDQHDYRPPRCSTCANRSPARSTGDATS